MGIGWSIAVANPYWNFDKDIHVMELLSLISSLFKPAAELVDDLHTSDEERLTLRNKLAEIQKTLNEKLIEYEASLLDARKEIIVAEARGESAFQRNWRPGAMVIFLALLVSYWLGYAPPNLSQETLNSLFDLLKIGIGGYIVGRSAEKIVKSKK